MSLNIELRPKIWQKLYTVWKEVYQMTADAGQEVLPVVDCLKSTLLEYGFSPDNATAIATSVDHALSLSFSDPNLSPDIDEELSLSLLDMEYIKNVIENNPLIPDSELKLIIAFAAFTRLHPHKSNWIKYERKDIFFLAGSIKIPTKDQETLTKRLHECYNLNMQVVGSNQPIPCYRFEWQATQAPISEEDNPLILIGPSSPTTIKSASEMLRANAQKAIAKKQQGGSSNG